LGWEKLQTKLLKKIKTHFISQIFFSNITQFTSELQAIRQRNRVKKNKYPCGFVVVVVVV